MLCCLKQGLGANSMRLQVRDMRPFPQIYRSVRVRLSTFPGDIDTG